MVNHIAYDRRMLLYSIQARRILAACLMRKVMLELVREDNGFTGETVTYSYDPWGNMLEKVTYAHTTEETLSGPVKTVTYTYGSTDWQDELTGISTVTGADTVNEQIVYDANGNAVSYRGATLTWNGKQLASWTKDSDSISYAYDENGLRLNKTVNGTRTDYYYNGSLLMSLVTGDDILLFSYDQGGNVVSVNYNGTEYYYLRNGQGDIVRLIDSSGTAVVTYGYDSWGRPVSRGGLLASTIGTLNPFRYRGYVYDEETQLYYLQSRYYDPEICRFLSSDVLLSTGQGTVGCNAFAYCLNNPVVLLDFDGCRVVARNDCFGGGGTSEDDSDALVNEFLEIYENSYGKPFASGKEEIQYLHVEKIHYTETIGSYILNIVTDSYKIISFLGNVAAAVYNKQKAWEFVTGILVSVTSDFNSHDIGTERVGYKIQYQEKEEVTIGNEVGNMLHIEALYDNDDFYRLGPGTKDGLPIFDTKDAQYRYRRGNSSSITEK